MLETWVRSLGGEDPLEKEMAIYSSTIAWKIPWTEEPGRLQSMGLQRVRHDWATSPYLTLTVSTFLPLFICSVILLFQKNVFPYYIILWKFSVESDSQPLHSDSLPYYIFLASEKFEFLLCSSCYCWCLVSKLCICKLCLTLLGPLWTVGQTGSSVSGISQARILEWVGIPSPGDLPDPGVK